MRERETLPEIVNVFNHLFSLPKPVKVQSSIMQSNYDIQPFIIILLALADFEKRDESSIPRNRPDKREGNERLMYPGSLCAFVSCLFLFDFLFIVIYKCSGKNIRALHFEMSILKIAVCYSQA